MALSESLLPEFDLEMDATRRALERVPDERFDWRPHERSMTLHDLAAHLAELPQWAVETLGREELDLGTGGWERPEIETTEDVLARFDETAAAARGAIEEATDERWFSSWTLKNEGEEIFSSPRVGVVRRMVMNHIVHHRGQLTVYLRLLEVPVPQTFGPTADEPEFGR